MPFNNEIKFWLQHEYIEGDRMYIRNVFILSTDVKSAIKDAFGFTVRPASPFKYDVCTQQEGESGHLYWFADIH